MNAEIYAEWLRRQGHRVLKTRSSWWHSEGWGVYQAFPYHQFIDPEGDEIRWLLKQGAVLRYSMCVQDRLSANGYHVMVTSGSYSAGKLSSRPRKNLRRALRNCSVEPITFQGYIHEGWPLRVDTLLRQGRKLNESESSWRRRFESAADLPGFEIWAAHVHGKLAATLVTFRMGDWYYLLCQQSHRDYLSAMVNNALTFVVTEAFSNRAGVAGIFYGMSSLDAAATVDEFKFHMGFERRPILQKIVLRPLLSAAINPATHLVVHAARALCAGNRALAKADGLFRLARGLPSSCSPQADVGAERR